MYEAVTGRESYRQIREHEKAVLDQQAMQAYAENTGYKKGEIKDEIKGETMKVIKLTMSKIKKGKSLAEIVDDLEGTEAEIRPIYDTVMKHRDVTDPERIYEILKE